MKNNMNLRRLLLSGLNREELISFILSRNTVLNYQDLESCTDQEIQELAVVVDQKVQVEKAKNPVAETLPKARSRKMTFNLFLN